MTLHTYTYTQAINLHVNILQTLVLTLVPSSEVAKYCLSTKFEDSNCGGSDFKALAAATPDGPSEASPSDRVDGLDNNTSQ